MDPLSALGVAGNVIQFVDFGFKVIKAGRELHKKGSLQIYQEIEQRTRQLQNFTAKLRQGVNIDPQSWPLTENARALQKLSQDCDETAQTLLAQLTELKLKLPEQPSIDAPIKEQHQWIDSIKILMNSIWNRKEIEELEDKLEKDRTAIHTLLLVSIRDQNELLSLQQSQRFNALDRETKYIADRLLRDIQQNISRDIQQQTEALAQLFNQQVIVVWDKRSTVINADQECEYPHQADLVKQSEKLESQIRSQASQDLLASLEFDAQMERYERLPQAHERTFSWVFDQNNAEEQQWDNFVDWLESGNGLYWIQGKPGSGKSTLMKYLCRNSLTRTHLQTWAKDASLYRAEFYFWALGSKTLQKSQVGLWRSLLWQVLSDDLKLIFAVFPKRWASLYSQRSLSQESKIEPWTLEELRLAWDRLVQVFNEPDEPRRLAIFVDGLDEFEGLDSDLAKLFSFMANSPNVKVCASSRPERAYERAFAQCQSLRLQDLTYNDIRNYVQDHLMKHDHMQALAQQSPTEAAELIKEIVQAANGVFLWVYLVVASLLKGLDNEDTIADLKRELQRLPKTLKELYIHMIVRDGEIRYKEEAITFFMLMNAIQHLDGDLVSPTPMTILAMCLAVECNAILPQTGNREINPDSLTPIFQDMSRRIKSRTGGLLEVEVQEFRSAALIPETRVGYLHRTVREFLVTPEMRHFLQEERLDFDPDDAMFYASFYELQIMDPDDRDPLWLSTLNYSRRCQVNERQHASSHAALLGQLYTAKPRRPYRTSGPDLHMRRIDDVDGASVYRRSDTWEYFLYTAVEFDLHVYLRNQLPRNKVFPTSSVKRRLIQHALSLSRKIRPETVLALLVNGVDPFSADFDWQSAPRAKFRRSISQKEVDAQRITIFYAVVRYLRGPFSGFGDIMAEADEAELIIWSQVLKRLLPLPRGPLEPEVLYTMESIYSPYPNLYHELRSRARNSAVTPRNINAGWSKTGVFPWNPDRVLKDIQPPPGANYSTGTDVVKLARCSDGKELLQTPQTPITADGLKLSCHKMRKEARGWDEDSKLLVNRLAHATEKAFADRALRNDNERLLAQNNEKRSRTSKPVRKVGNAKVMSYEDIIEAQRNLEAKKASQAGKRKTNSSSGRRPKRSCSDDVRRVEDEIQSWDFKEYCSVISF